MKRTPVFFLFANPYKPDTVSTSVALAQRLLGRGARVLMDPWLFGCVGLGEACELAELPEDTTAVVSLGGDGTLLRTVAHAARKGIPVLGIHMGRVGFLLEVHPDEIAAAVDRLMAGEYHLEERMMLACQVNDGEELLVMNDVALTRGQSPSSIEVKACADDEVIFTSRGDGLLVATPTGTTGYALSAGGPVVYPLMSCLVLVSICSHILTQRPIVMPDDKVIVLTASAHREQPCQIIMDGQTVINLSGEVRVQVRRAVPMARFIRFGRPRFLSRLREKQAEWNVM